MLGRAAPKVPAPCLDSGLRQLLLMHPGDGRADEALGFFLAHIGVDLGLAGGCNFAQFAHLVSSKEVRWRVPQLR